MGCRERRMSSWTAWCQSRAWAAVAGGNRRRPRMSWGGTMASAPGRSVVPADRPTLSVSARRLLRAPVSRRFWADRCYAGLSFLLAVPCCAFIVVAVILGLGLSFSFAGMLVGVPLLVASLRAARWLGTVCRGLAGRLLGRAGRRAAAVARQAGHRRLGPRGADRSGGVARLRLSAAQAAGRAAWHHRRGLPVAVRAAVPDLSPVVAGRAQCGDPDTCVAFLVDGRPACGWRARFGRCPPPLPWSRLAR